MIFSEMSRRNRENDPPALNRQDSGISIGSNRSRDQPQFYNHGRGRGAVAGRGGRGRGGNVGRPNVQAPRNVQPNNARDECKYLTFVEK